MTAPMHNLGFLMRSLNDMTKFWKFDRTLP